MGAQWVQGINNVVYELASAAGELRTDIRTQETTGYSDNVITAYVHNGKRIPQTQVGLVLNVTRKIYDSMDAEDLAKNNMSQGAYITQE